MASASFNAVHGEEGEPAGPRAEEVLAQLQQLLADRRFEASPARRELLRFLVEETLVGHAARLKGFTIAQAVFGRDDGFDPQSDPVVRVEARRLRRDLDSYYAGAGDQDRLRFAIPKGAYAVTFERRDAPQSRQPEAATPLPEPTPASRLKVPASRGRLARAGRLRPWWLAGAVAVALLAMLAMGWAWLGPFGSDVASDDAVQRHGPTVIVLPFEALSSVDGDSHLAMGITTELISDLMRFEGFRLYSAAASFRQAGSGGLAALTGEPAVSYVVRGNVASARGVVRVGATLTDARTDEVLWSESFERPLTPDNLLDLQVELASRIATTLGQDYGVVNADAAGRLQHQAAPSMATYQCILSAYEYRRTFDVNLHGPTVDCLEAAVRRDPDYAEAWAMLAWLKLDAVRFGLGPKSEVERLRAEARAASMRAVTLDPKSVRALQVLAVVRFYDGDYEASEAFQRRALALNPHDPETLAQLGWRLAVRGGFEEGLGYLQRAVDRSVNPPGWYFHLIAIHDFMQGRYAAALAAAERSARNDSEVGLSLVAMSAAALGDEAAARRSLERLAAVAPGFYADPEAVYRSHQATDGIVEALMAGLRQAGWSRRETSAAVAP